MVGNFVDIYLSEMMAKNAFKLSTVVGADFEIYSSQMAKNAFKLYMVGENFNIYSTQMAKNAFKLSTMVGEYFEIYFSQMSKNAFKTAFKLSTMVGEDFEIYLNLKWLTMHLNCPSWLEKFLKFTYLKWLKK